MQESKISACVLDLIPWGFQVQGSNLRGPVQFQAIDTIVHLC